MLEQVQAFVAPLAMAPYTRCAGAARYVNAFGGSVHVVAVNAVSPAEIRRLARAKGDIGGDIEPKLIANFIRDYKRLIGITWRKGRPPQRVGYRRFATAAEAIRFAVEDFPALRTLGAWMQVGDERFDSNEIHRLYDSDDFPLQRRPG